VWWGTGDGAASAGQKIQPPPSVPPQPDPTPPPPDLGGHRRRREFQPPATARSPSLCQGQERRGGKAPVERRGGSSADRRERIGLGRRERRERKGVCGGRRERGRVWRCFYTRGSGWMIRGRRMGSDGLCSSVGSFSFNLGQQE
jgi:hypothetical protein